MAAPRGRKHADGQDEKVQAVLDEEDVVEVLDPELSHDAADFDRASKDVVQVKRDQSRGCGQATLVL